MYQKEVDNLKNEIAGDLRASASSYYKIGIDIFHEYSTKSWVDFQPAIGNLAISVELMLKSLVAKKAIHMLYSNLPDEAQLLLCYPESLTKEHNSQSFLNDMKNFVFKVIELDKSVSFFYHFFPELKREYKQFFSSLSIIRNMSVHASIPNFQSYELERIAYFSTKLFLYVSELNLFKYYTFEKETKIESFLRNYKDEKIKKVKATLDKARETVKRGNLSDNDLPPESWDTMCGECPICKDTGTYFGETEMSTDYGYDGDVNIELLFLCESFSCTVCGLELDDYEELGLADMEISIDREEDIDQWRSEKESDDYYNPDDQW